MAADKASGKGHHTQGRLAGASLVPLLLHEYSKRRSQIRKRLDEFSKVPDSEYFYELCFCLLTPQSSAYRCWEAVECLKAAGFIRRKIDPKLHLGKVRFHNNKAKYLLEWKKKHMKIIEDIKKEKNAKALREILVKNVKGLGYKESSHFLRNIGRRDLAILDRHILKNLMKHSAIGSIPKTLTKKKYMEIENRFKSFSDRIGIPMDELDLLFWSEETGKVFK